MIVQEWWSSHQTSWRRHTLKSFPHCLFTFASLHILVFSSCFHSTFVSSFSLHSFLVCSFFSLSFKVTLYAFRFFICFVFSYITFLFLLHLFCNFFLHFQSHWIYIYHLIAMDDETMEVFVLSCLLLLIQMVQQMFQSSPTMLRSLATLE